MNIFRKYMYSDNENSILWMIPIILIYWFFIIIFNEIQYFLYSIFLGGFLILVFFKKLSKYSIQKKIVLSLTFLVIINIFVAGVFSLSPKLKIIDFKFLNPDWVEVENNKITDYKAYWVYGTRGSSYETADVSYIYNNFYTSTEEKVVHRDNYYFDFRDSDVRIKEINEYIGERVLNRDYLIMNSLKDPKVSKLFISTDWINLKYSVFYYIVVNISCVVVFPFSYFIYIIYKRKKRLNEFQKKYKETFKK